MTITANEARQIFKTVEALGGTVPAELSGLLELEDRIRNAPAAPRKYPLTDLAASTALSDKEIAAALQESATALMVDTARQDLLRRFHVEIPYALKNALKGAAGDALFDSLRPVVSEHIATLDRVATELPAGVTAERVIELGEKAAQAWRDGPAAAQALDTVLWQVVRPIATEAIAFDPNILQHGQARFLVFMVNLDNGPDPDSVASAYTSGREVARDRLSGWRTLMSTSALGFNSPSQVQAYLDEQADTTHEANLQKYTPRSADEAFATV